MPGADRLGMGLSMSLLILSGDTTGSRVRRISPSITVAHTVKVPESVSCNDTAWHGPGGAVSSLTIGWSA